MTYYAVLPKTEGVYHFGIKERSGRYPWGSGERPYQRLEKKSLSYRVGEASLRATLVDLSNYRKHHWGRLSQRKQKLKRQTDRKLHREEMIRQHGAKTIAKTIGKISVIGATSLAMTLNQVAPLKIASGAALGIAKIGMEYVGYYRKSKKADALV